MLQSIVIEEYLKNEVRLGRVLGPLEPRSHPRVQINRFGLVPKNHQPGKWRLIVDLRGASVNDGVEPELCSMKYTSVDEVVRKVLALVAGTLMAKFDMEGAYRTVPVHPEDRWLFGKKWGGQVVCGQDPAIRPQVCPQNLQRIGRCYAVDFGQRRCGCHPLPG